MDFHSFYTHIETVQQQLYANYLPRLGNELSSTVSIGINNELDPKPAVDPNRSPRDFAEHHSDSNYSEGESDYDPQEIGKLISGIYRLAINI